MLPCCTWRRKPSLVCGHSDRVWINEKFVCVCVHFSRPLADTEKLPVRTHRPEVLKSPGADEDGEGVQQEPKKRSSKEKKEKKKDKDKERKV